MFYFASHQTITHMRASPQILSSLIRVYCCFAGRLKRTLISYAIRLWSFLGAGLNYSKACSTVMICTMMMMAHFHIRFGSDFAIVYMIINLTVFRLCFYLIVSIIKTSSITFL